MKPTIHLDRGFSLSAGFSEPLRLRAPALLSGVRVTSSNVLGNRAFMRAWAARRVALARASAGASDAPSLR